MNRSDIYRNQLTASTDPVKFLADNSNLPGPRGNLELLGVFALYGSESDILKCLGYDEHIAPTNTPGEFVATCGAAGTGRLIAEGRSEYFPVLRRLARDSRWRVREGVAFALQLVGMRDFRMLIPVINDWKTDDLLVRRAVVAGLCEPALLKDEANANYTLDILKEIISGIKSVPERKDPAFLVLKKGLGYALSVAVAALPDKGKQIFEELADIKDKDIRWILRNNLDKNRLIKMDGNWVERMKTALIFTGQPIPWIKGR
jgi:hypothetical protein